jgi:hypothetical protein
MNQLTTGEKVSLGCQQLRMLTNADVCSRMLTYAGEKVSLGCQKLDKLRAVLAKADEWCVHPLNLEPSHY